LGQESPELLGVFASGMCLYYVQTIWPIGIGSYYNLGFLYKL
jgi:hypothetical protein